MNQGKYGLRAFGLAIGAALGLMAFMAVGAQANWLYLEGATVKTLTENELVKVIGHSATGTLLITGVNLQLTCNSLVGEDLLLEPGTATTAAASGTIAFGECQGIEKSTGKTIANCAPINQPIKAAGKALIILHTNGQNYFLFEPATGKPFTEIKYSELCALTETSKITGELVLECGLLNESKVFVHEDCKNHQKVHLLQQASEALFPSQMKYGTHVMTFDGIVAAELAGKHEGASWSGEV